MAWDKTKPATSSLMVSSDIRNNWIEIDRLMRSGASTTNGDTGRTVTISPALADTSYAVDIEFTDAQYAFAGEVRITNKATNAFVVKNSGDANVAFNWGTRPKI